MDLHATFSADEHYRGGLEHLDEERYSEALERFRAAHRLDPGNAGYRSYYGLCLGLAERHFDKALHLCRAAAKEEFFNPALYHNLARVHLAFGFKAEAIRYLRRGLMIAPDFSPILSEMEELGLRRPPVLRFLRRRHVLNRWLGSLRRRPTAAPPSLELHNA